MDNNGIQDLTERIEDLKRTGKYAEARLILEQVVAEIDNNYDPEDTRPPWYHQQLGIVLRKLGFKEEAKVCIAQADEIVIRNYINHSKIIYEMPIEIRMTYYPNGPVVTKKVLESAARLQNTNPELLKAAGLL
jgi:tetratricopeptide (TPR) repeat protein